MATTMATMAVRATPVLSKIVQKISDPVFFYSQDVFSIKI